MISALISLLLNGAVLHHDKTIVLLEKGINEEPMWGNGLVPDFGLPEEASPREVAAKALAANGRGIAEPKQVLFLIRREEQVILRVQPEAPYTALHCYTAAGERIVLMRYEENTQNWWTCVYDAKAIRVEMRVRAKKLQK